MELTLLKMDHVHVIYDRTLTVAEMMKHVKCGHDGRRIIEGKLSKVDDGLRGLIVST